ncbi:YopX family protein [Alkalicoccobacillus gibsonii]|uniref:YopX family protein n=1 Tax=Alkalicoccobacillus gibsonii TaxID=79881 RepID=UPI0019319FCD|nr:YopX family protein [Alkalicoccobacillus gibsonii]MBM0064956.1 hypothetical protein [Alkalicoccobacillus gibsonii]
MNIRAYDPDREEMYGDGMMYGKEELMDDSLNIRFEHFECDEPIFMYGSGVHDKNEKEIFSDDIYKDSLGRVYHVKFDLDRVGFHPFATDDGCGCCSDEYVAEPERGEVIGNIHQHPHLLEKANE